MAARVYLHVGLPKTATTYLQTILWGNREVLEQQQLRLPGAARHDHLWASRVVRQDPAFANHSPHRHRAWERLQADVAVWPGTALISHEFFAAASTEQAAAMVADLAPAEVHLVVTAREPLGLFTASWQESLKNRDTTAMRDYARVESDQSTAIWNWRTLDVRLVLERWAPPFPAEHVHVLPLPGRDAPKREIWDRFATLVGIDPDSVDLSRSFPNASMGVVEAETLRRINHYLGGFNSSIDRATFIRTYLADQRLVPRGGDPFWPGAERAQEIRERGERAVAHIAEHGFDVVGDLDRLLVPDSLPERRVPESVTEREMAILASQLVASLLEDVRDLRGQRKDLQSQLAVSRSKEDPGLRAGLVRKFPLLRPVLLRGEQGE